MSVGSIFFAFCSLVALLGAVGTVAARNPIRCAVSLLVTIVGIAGLYLQLHAQFLAAIQIIVYAGAVVVLFVFVIMLLGPDADAAAPTPARARSSRFIAAGLLGLLAVGAAVLLLGSELPATRFGVARPEHGSVEAVGRLLFTDALVVFELATALLIVAVVGAIGVAKHRLGTKPRKQIENPTRRLFHGPIHPRDAGRPLPKEGIL